MNTSSCSEHGRIVRALDVERPAFLTRVEALIKEEERAKTEEEVRVQQKIQQMGVCPMNYQWLKVSGGWQCAGGGHFLPEGAV